MSDEREIIYMEEPRTNKENAMYALEGAKMVVVGVGTLAWRGASWIVGSVVKTVRKARSNGEGKGSEAGVGKEEDSAEAGE